MKVFDIAIAGEINLDLILYGLPKDMPLERELLATGFQATLGGSSAIVAHNASCLGARVSFTTLLGKDDFGSMALQKLRTSGVETSHTAFDSNRSTGVTFLLPHGEHRHILTYPGTIAELTVSNLDLDFITQSRHFHLSSLYLQRGLHQGLPDLLSDIKHAGLSISLDTNDDPDDRWGFPLHEILPFVDIFLPNESELCRMAATPDLDGAIKLFAQKVPAIVVKRGAQGAYVHQEGRGTDVAPLKVLPVDTIGAGDSFDAGFLWAYTRGQDLTTCAKAGNITGALSTQSPGGTEAFVDVGLRNSFLAEHKFFDLVAPR
ncbi:MAG: sugar kinase [Acidobacteriota bacterium]|nr:sugar kinase [Acidobacteriota bacterium]